MEGPKHNEKIDLRRVSDEEIRKTELERREQFLRTIGFSDKEIEEIKSERPTLYDPVDGQRKVELLKALGFANPEKMITTLPAILGLNIENIERKVDTLGAIFKLYNIKIKAMGFVEKNLSLLGTKINKVWIAARALRTIGVDANLVTESFLSRLLFSNITDTTAVATLLEGAGAESVDPKEFIKAIKEAKNMSISEKDRIIERQSISKLSRRYKRGYGH